MGATSRRRSRCSGPGCNRRHSCATRRRIRQADKIRASRQAAEAPGYRRRKSADSRPELIHPRVNRRRPVVPLAKFERCWRAKLPRPFLDQEFGCRKIEPGAMRPRPPFVRLACSRSARRRIALIRFRARGGASCDRFENRGVRRRLEEQDLIEPEAQKIARGRIERLGTKLPDPEIEQGEIAQHAVEKLERKTAIGSAESELRRAVCSMIWSANSVPLRQRAARQGEGARIIGSASLQLAIVARKRRASRGTRSLGRLALRAGRSRCTGSRASASFPD